MKVEIVDENVKPTLSPVCLDLRRALVESGIATEEQGEEFIHSLEVQAGEVWEEFKRGKAEHPLWKRMILFVLP